MVDGFTIGLKVSKKSIPSCCRKPLAISLALWHWIMPSSLYIDPEDLFVVNSVHMGLS